jgi:hypothetical protein
MTASVMLAAPCDVAIWAAISGTASQHVLAHLGGGAAYLRPAGDAARSVGLVERGVGRGQQPIGAGELAVRTFHSALLADADGTVHVQHRECGDDRAPSAAGQVAEHGRADLDVGALAAAREEPDQRGEPDRQRGTPAEYELRPPHVISMRAVRR